MAEDKKFTMTREALLGIASDIKALQKRLDELPTLPEFPMDGNTYGFRNGQIEIVAGDGEEVLTQDAPTAVSLAIQTVMNQQFAVGPDDPLFAEMVALIPEDIFNDIASQNVATLERKAPALTDEQRLAEAIGGYWERKAQAEARKAELERRMLEASNDVEPEKKEEI